MSFQDLERLFLEEDYEVSLYISQAQLTNGDLTVNFSINRGFEISKETDEKWTIRAIGHRDSRITLGSAGGILLEEDHPLLWKYGDIQCELYFSGKWFEPENLIADLYKVDIGLFRNYQPFGTFLNGDIFKLLEAEHGLLAKGPKKLLFKYAQCLEKHKVVYSMIGERLPTYWDGKAHIPEASGYKIMLFSMDYGYIIAKDFDLIRQ